MMRDAQLQFSDAQAVTVDAPSTNIIDLGVARNLFDGEPLAIVVEVDVNAVYPNTDETYEIQVEMDDNEAFNTPTDLSATVFPYTALVKGKHIILPMPIGVEIERYLRLYFNTGGTAPAVTLTAYLQPLSAIEKLRTYKRGYTVS